MNRYAPLKRSPIRISAAALGLTGERKKRSHGWGGRKFTPNDTLWSLVIRTRDGFTCRKCGRTSGKLEAAHLFTAGKPTTRCDEDNGFTLCARPCHRDWAEHHATEYHAWAKAQLGASRYDRLLLRSNLTGLKQQDDVINRHLKSRLKHYQGLHTQHTS